MHVACNSLTVQNGNGNGNGVGVPASGPIQFYYRDPAPWPTELQLPTHDLDAKPYVDLIVAGAGPAGVAVAQRVAAAGFSVCVVDPNPLSTWPNNYGVWVDEFQAMGLEDCLEVVWPKAKVWLSSGPQGEKFLSRPYGRVDRPKLKRKLLEKCIATGVTFLNAKVDGVTHADGSSTLSTVDGRKIQGSLVLDATGHVRKLVEFDKKFDPGYQGAYGIIAEVESHPFDIDTMLFMDWRDNHTAGLEDMHKRNVAVPTFLYAMPFSPTRIFLEETSLVFKPAVEFNDLKERLDARLAWLGIKVKHIEEEEYCLIPMGGALPKHPQRVIAIGGSAGMVHPSTGFMMSRMLGAAPQVADAIIDQLSLPADKASDMGAARRPRSEEEANAMAAAVWRATWPVERLQQRAFYNFGMAVLLKLNLYDMREFFAAFFSLSPFNWHGFLSTRLTFLQLIGFGLALFAQASNTARITLLSKGLPDLVTMLAGLVPLLGDYYGTGTVQERKADFIKNAIQPQRLMAQGASQLPPPAARTPLPTAADSAVTPEAEPVERSSVKV